MSKLLTDATALATADASSACWYVDNTLAGVYADVDGLVPATAGSQVALIADKRYLDYTRRNRILNSETAAFGGFSTFRATVAAYSGGLPSAVLSAISIIPDTTSSTHALYLALPTALKPTGSFMSFSMFAKAAEYNYLRLAFIGAGVTSAAVVFDLVTGTVYSNPWNLPVMIIPQGNGWYRCGIAALIVDGAQSVTAQCLVMSTSTTQAFAGDGVSGLAISGVQVEQAALPSDYQRVLGSWPESLPGYPAYQLTAASRPILTAEANGLYSLLFDGVDDYLVTNHKLATSSNFAFIAAGSGNTNLSGTLMGGLSSNSNSRFYAGANANLEPSAGAYNRANTGLKLAGGSTVNTSVMSVSAVSAAVEFAVNNVVAVNNVLSAVASLAVNYIGCLNNNGTPSQFWVGKFYAACIINGAVSSDDLTTIIKAFAGFAGLAVPGRDSTKLPTIVCPTGGSSPQSYSPTLISESQSLLRQVRTTLTQRWTMTYSWDNIPRDKGQQLLAFLANQRGRYGVFELPLFGDDGNSSGTAAGTLVASEAAAKGATSVKASGFLITDDGLAVGDFIRFAGHSKLYQLVQGGESAGGVAWFEIYPQLFADVALGESITVNNLTIAVSLDSDTVESRYEPGKLMSLSIKCLEVLP